MPRRLTESQIADYRADGYLYPLPGIGIDRAKAYRKAFEAFEASAGGPLNTLPRAARYKTHTHLPWCWEIASDPAILDVIEDLLGPDILIWTSSFFVKEARTEAVALWHQDSTYFGLSPSEHVTAWVALTNASAEAGCMQFLSQHGSPRQYRHRAKADAKSINGAGQSIAEPLDTAGAVTAALRPGEFSLHHTLCVHSSPANRSDDRRIGIGISYIPPHVRHNGTVPVSATLVRGTDRYGHFERETPAGADDERNEHQHARASASFMSAYAEQVKWHEEQPG